MGFLGATIGTKLSLCTQLPRLHFIAQQNLPGVEGKVATSLQNGNGPGHQNHVIHLFLLRLSEMHWCLSIQSFRSFDPRL